MLRSFATGSQSGNEGLFGDALSPGCSVERKLDTISRYLRYPCARDAAAFTNDLITNKRCRSVWTINDTFDNDERPLPSMCAWLRCRKRARLYPLGWFLSDRLLFGLGPVCAVLCVADKKVAIFFPSNQNKAAAADLHSFQLCFISIFGVHKEPRDD